jgi:GR25 family glycosyltransferase involved in LPS biosynthesis
MLNTTIPIYVISVKSFLDRHEHIERLAKSLDLQFEYVWAFDADDLTEDDFTVVSKSLCKKSASNVLKHMHAQALFLETGKEVGLVLEDDVILFKSFLDGLRRTIDLAKDLPPGWLIFLGGADNKIDSRFFESKDLCLVERSLTTAEAYLIDRRGCELRAQWLSNHIIDRQADHQLKLIDDEIGLRQYSVSKPLATQGSITGLFSTSLDASRSKHSALFLRFKYEYNRFRRQTLGRILATVKRILS